MGPLEGYRILEIAGIGPGPFCGMVLSDLGAEVIRVDRSSARGGGNKFDVLSRGRRSIAVDLKNPGGVETVLRLVEKCDALFEGFRPGVMEKLGLGPEACLARNGKLVYGRMTGWGQHGTLEKAAGHDINYIAISGALHAIGRAGEKPVPPLNLVGDFGGGGMLLALGIVAALLERHKSGKGQVVDAAMTDGSALLMAMMYGFHAMGTWSNNRGKNLLDTGAHFYETYECADGKWVALGSIEPQFYALLMEKAGLADPDFKGQMNIPKWPVLKEKLAAVIKQKTRDQWCELMEGTDVCFAPVLDFDEAPKHPHNVARKTFTEIGGVTQPAPAPRFSRTPGAIQGAPVKAGAQTEEILKNCGFSADEINSLKESKAIA